MKLSELMAYSQAAFDAWGDLDCYMDIEGDEIVETVEMVCELGDNDARCIVITNYELPERHLKVVR